MVAVLAVFAISAPVDALIVFAQVTVVLCAVAGLYCSGIVPMVAPWLQAATRISTFAVTVQADLDNELVFTVLAYAKLTELVDVELEKIADASTYFENELGGRILALGTKFTGANLLYKGRLKQLHAVIKKLFSGKLPFMVENAITVAPFWFKDNDGDILFLYNFGFDMQRFVLRTSRGDVEIEIEPLSIKEFVL